ncbi:flavin monoamine oxidase family protein [Exiguobacterium flavidum]|uniref:flavin monoamine oxidase family protein n=1 Tax=Exiguobacterium flavidum TaxID=2184695 RepID=UPI000DF7C497|nr:FAD-dependent oxidoreductase [Exiguobacterium flavidum]
MKISTAIIGAGVSGLYAASLLNKSGQAVTVFETRQRIGGRILSEPVSSARGTHLFDLGPTWYWPESEHTISRLVDEYGLTAFSQPTAGAMVLERQAGRVEHHVLPKESIVPSNRLEGGMTTLVEALARQLPPGTILLGTKVTAIRQAEDRVAVTYTDEQGTLTELYDRVVLALPPRLVDHIAFEPALSGTLRAKLNETPTWMAGQAKAIAVYETPFWREEGQSGFGISWVGPLQEIHDASPTEGPGALFGFLRLSPEERQRVGEAGVKARVLEQLVQLYGTQANHPIAFLYYDWSADIATATAEDALPLTDFPVFRPIEGDDSWQDRIAFAGTETNGEFGGHIEGALRSAERIVSRWMD